MQKRPQMNNDPRVCNHTSDYNIPVIHVFTALIRQNKTQQLWTELNFSYFKIKFLKRVFVKMYDFHLSERTLSP